VNKFNGERIKVKIPFPMKYSLINLKFMVLCLETSINPKTNSIGKIVQKLNVGHKKNDPIKIGINKINFKIISIL
jgi:hypothetical protein